MEHIILKYCTYITFYRGNKLPPFYIGSSSMEKIENGYRGSVVSKRYQLTWRSEIRNSPHLFKTVVISRHSTRKEATAKETKILRILKAHINPLYINMNISGYYFTPLKGKDNPAYGTKRPDLTRNNQDRTLSLMVFDKEWNFIKTSTASLMSNELNVMPSNIQKLAKNWFLDPNKTIGGFKYIYQKDYDKNKLELLRIKGHIGRTPVKQYDLQMNFIESFSSVKEASDSTGIGFDNIYKCYKDKQKSAGGFKWTS